MHLIIDCTTTQNQLKYNGVGQYTKAVVERMIKDKDVSFTLLLFEAESTLDDVLNENIKNVEIVRIGKLKKSDYLNILWYITRILPSIRKYRRKNTVYFCPYFWAGIPSLWIPTVLMVHDFTLPLFNIYSEQGILKNFIKKILYWLEMFKARYCKAIVTNSQCTTNDFKKYFPRYKEENIHTIYLDGFLTKGSGSWKEKLPKDFKEKGYFIYMGGTLYKNKNSNGVIKGYKNFLTKFKSLKEAPYLVIAGKNFTKEVDPNVEKFKNKIHCLGMDSKVIFTGFYEDTQVEPLLKNSLAFIHLSLYEGFGIALVEAMRAGTPVIAHKGSCYPEVLSNSGLLVDGIDEKEVGKAMYDIYSNKDLRKELIEKGFNRAKDFSWERTAKETLEVFTSLRV